MTTLTTLVGLVPMALGIDVGSETNVPLARAVIGGLAVSTVLHAGPDPDALRDARGAVPPPRRDARGGARRTRRRRMTVIASLRLLAVIRSCWRRWPTPAAAQPTARDPMAPRDPLPAPAVLEFPRLAGDRRPASSASSKPCAIALANQPHHPEPRRATTWPRNSAWPRPCRRCCPSSAASGTASRTRTPCRSAGQAGRRRPSDRVDADDRDRHRLPAPLRLRQELGGHRCGEGQQRVRARERGAAEGPHRAGREAVRTTTCCSRAASSSSMRRPWSGPT